VRVLVVEDEPALSAQLARAFGDAGYAVDCAADGERADVLAQTERSDAVVLDLGLPKIDRLTLVRRWRDAQLSMEGRYPAEVQPLATDLNALLDHREQAVSRALAKAGDLAELYGGAITLESSPLGGLRAVLALPG
jgi:CheY-like chemotaxis protein